MDSDDGRERDAMSEFERLFGVQDPDLPAATAPPIAPALWQTPSWNAALPPASPEFLGADALAAPPGRTPAAPAAQGPPSTPLLPPAPLVASSPGPATAQPPVALPAFGAGESSPVRREGAHAITPGAHAATGPITLPGAFDTGTVPPPLMPPAAAPAVRVWGLEWAPQEPAPSPRWAPEPPPLTQPAAPAPVAPSPVFTPATAAPSQATQTAPPAAAAPFDSTGVPASPVVAGDRPWAPLLLGSAPVQVDDSDDLARSSVGERILFALAFLLPPIGFVGGLIAAGLSARRRGWVVGLVRATIAVSAVLSVGVGVGGYYGHQYLQQQARHAELVHASAKFCATLAKNPGMLEPPTFGWPAVAPSIPDSLTAMQAFVSRWDGLAKESPAGIRAEVTKIADAGRQIVGSVTVSRTVDDAQNVALMTSVASGSGVPAWHAEYCS